MTSVAYRIDKLLCQGFFATILILAGLATRPLAAQEVEVPDAVLDIFDDKCAFSGCHAGTSAPKGLDLTEDFVLSSLVNKPSADVPSHIRVKPRDPVGSYLMMKLRGDSGIEGERMPKDGSPLDASEIETLNNWINSLPAALQTEAPEREYAEAFPGFTLASLTTPQTLEKGLFAFRIAHRWRGDVGSGFDQLFGLDGGAHMFTQLSFPLTDNSMFSVARSGNNATLEFAAKWRFMREKNDGSVPVSAAIYTGVDWETAAGLADPDDAQAVLARSDGQRFHWFAQLPVSKQLSNKISVLVAPGVLLNGNVSAGDEDPVITVGFAAKFMMAKDFSVFVEGVPIISGASGAAPVGGGTVDGGELKIYDAFTIGLERKAGGHVFHVYITNSLGLATGQYMSGGNFDFSDRDVRLGFNIYRKLRFP